MINESIIEQLKAYIKERYVLHGDVPQVGPRSSVPSANFPAIPGPFARRMREPEPAKPFARLVDKTKQYIDNNQTDTLSVFLRKKCEEKNIAPPQLYDKAGIDRKYFSKSINVGSHRPAKNVVIALGLVLKLTRQEMDELLASADYAFNKSSVLDLVVLFCLENQIDDMFDINALLVAVGEKILFKDPKEEKDGKRQ
jgi:hypothetical protein